MNLRSFLQSVGQDVQFALRSFRESPLFTSAAIVTLALGIAANTAIFSVVNAVIIDSLALRFIHEPDRLTMIWERAPRLGQIFSGNFPVRSKDFVAWRRENHSFAEMAIWRKTALNVSDSDAAGRHRPERVDAGTASPNFFSVLGVPLQLGRTFSSNETAGNARVAILNDSLYRSRFGGDPDVLGKSIRAEGVDYTIIGVLPSGFNLPAMWGGQERSSILLWLPMNPTEKGGVEELNNCFVYGRLKPGATLANAQADISALQKRLSKTDEELTFFSGVGVSSIRDEDSGTDLRGNVIVLQAAVGFVLLIACANVANLLLTRAVGREKEMAIRVALGAGRLRLLRQILTESLVLSFVGGVVGALLGYWGSKLVSYLAPKDTHGLHELRMDPLVLLFTLAVTATAGILFGLAPYLHIRKQDINKTLNRSSRSLSGSSGGLRKALNIAELGLSVVLLVGAGLMIRTLSTLMSTDLGFQRDHLLSMHLSLPDAQYSSTARVESFNRQVIEAVRQQPGIQSAFLTSAIPMQSFQKSSFNFAGEDVPNDQVPVSACARVGNRYFETLRTPLLAGRTIRPDDPGSGTSVAVVNQSFAEKHGGMRGVLGKVIKYAGDDGKEGRFRIVGIVANERQLGPDHPTEPEFFLPARALKEFYLLARTSGDPLSHAGAVQSAIWKLDASLPAGNVKSMNDALSEWTAPRRFIMSILIAFAVLAVVLAAIGLYGVLAYGVTLRTREIGIRVALGAEPSRVARTVVVEGIQLAIAGIAIGLVAAGLLARFMQSMIYGVDALDPVTFITVPVVLAAVAIVASYLPARRAATVDPTVALRAE